MTRLSISLVTAFPALWALIPAPALEIQSQSSPEIKTPYPFTLLSGVAESERETSDGSETGSDVARHGRSGFTV